MSAVFATKEGREPVAIDPLMSPACFRWLSKWRGEILLRRMSVISGLKNGGGR